VITSPPEGLGPARQVLTSCFSGTCFCENRRLVLSCHGFRIGQDYPDRPKRGQIALQLGLCKTHPRRLKSTAYFQSFWASKMTSRMKVRSAVMLQSMSLRCHNPAQFVGHGRLLNLFFGSSQTEHWLPRYGHFKFCRGRGVQIPSLLVVCSWFSLTDSVRSWFARLVRACVMYTMHKPCANLNA
jgi:hypothetical protein